MKESLFGTDGVRGRVGQEPISPQTMMKLGWAAGCVFSQKGKGDKVLIGKDTRISGYLLESALEAGFSAAGGRYLFTRAHAYTRHRVSDTHRAGLCRGSDQRIAQSILR